MVVTSYGQFVVGVVRMRVVPLAAARRTGFWPLSGYVWRVLKWGERGVDCRVSGA